MYFVYILYCSFTRYTSSLRACSLSETDATATISAIDRRHCARDGAGGRRGAASGRATHPGANYDPITPGKMDDTVSRIINVSMDPHFHYVPIIAVNESKCLTNFARHRQVDQIARPDGLTSKREKLHIEKGTRH